MGEDVGDEVGLHVSPSTVGRDVTGGNVMTVGICVGTVVGTFDG